MRHLYPHQTVKFSMGNVSNIVCMDDFYKAVGIMDAIRSGQIRDVQQIWMNSKQVLRIEDICLDNIKTDKRFKGYTDKVRELAVQMDWLNYSPVSVAYVPQDEIWIWAKEHYQTSMDEYRHWYRCNQGKEI